MTAAQEFMFQSPHGDFGVLNTGDVTITWAPPADRRFNPLTGILVF